MNSLVLGALRARGGQTVALFALTVLAVVGASAAPWFLGWARDAVAAVDIASAPASQRTVTVSGTARLGARQADSPVAPLRDTVAEHLAIAGSEIVVGARLYATALPIGADAGAGLYVSFRENVCAHLKVVGGCLTQPGDVLVSRGAAERLGVGQGDVLTVESFRLLASGTVRVGGVYEVADLLDPYWAGTNLLAGPAGVAGAVLDNDPIFTSEQTLLGLVPTGLDVDLHMVLPDGAYQDGDLRDTLAVATSELRRESLGLRSEAPALLRQIQRDQRLVSAGVVVATTQLMLLCWFVLFLAVRHTAGERQPDIGLLRLRGARRWRIWALAVGQTSIPMMAGAAVGWVIGIGAAALLAGDVDAVINTVDADPTTTLILSLAAAAVAGAGALVAGLFAERRVLRAPVLDLLRRVPPRRRGWRATIGDVVVIALAAAGVYQGYADVRAQGEPSTFALLAPGLVGLAVALVVARALPGVAARSGSAALRAGRPGAALAALHLARRPGTQRVFAVLAVSASVFATSLLFWHTATVAWSERARQELGAERVLTVRAPNSAALLASVRAADPSGQHAMAVAWTSGSSAGDRVLAVDTSRLANVALLPAAYGLGDPARLAALLRPDVPPPVRVRDGPITLDATGPAARADQPPLIRLQLSTVDGGTAAVEFGPLDAGRRTYHASVTGCPGGCRLVAIEPVATGHDGSVVELHRLAQPDGEVVPGARFADVSRWRAQLSMVGVGPILAAREAGLAVSLYRGALPPTQRFDARVFVVDTPTPLPVALAGERPELSSAGDERLPVLGVDEVPYRVAATPSVLPRVGAQGVLMDLEYAQRSASRSAEAVSLEVWLTGDAPAGIVANLEARGVEVLADSDLATATDRLAGRGPGTALRFQLFAAGIVLLLAAGTVVITAAGERRPRAAELIALRSQGLTARSMRVAGYAGTGALVLAALLTGLLAAVLARILVEAAMPVFTDDWALLAPRTGIEPLPLAAAAAAGLLVLGTAAFTVSHRMVRTAGQQ